MTVRLTPGAGLDRIDGVTDGVLRVRVAAKPVGGSANEAMLRLLAAELGLPRSRVALYRGATSRLKVAELRGVVPELLRSRWPGIEV